MRQSPNLEPPPLPPVDEGLARARRDELVVLARKHGITNLRFASPGRLVGHREPGGDMFNVIDFELEAVRLLGKEVSLFADRVLVNPNVSPDLLAARPL